MLVVAERVNEGWWVVMAGILARWDWAVLAVRWRVDDHCSGRWVCLSFLIFFSIQ